MTKLEWGKKRTCQNCGAKYYDMQKDPPICPKCETAFQKETAPRGRRNRTTPEAPKTLATAAVETVNDGLDLEVIENNALEDDESLPEDTSDLGGDHDDMSEVVDNVDTENGGD